MQEISKWILSVLGAVVIGFIADALLSETKLQKTVRFVVATITLLIIVTPLPAIFSGNYASIGDLSFDYTVELDSDFLMNILNKKLEILSENTQKILSEAGVSNAEVSIEGALDEENEERITKVTINLTNCVIDQKIQHINKNELVKDTVLNYLEVEESVIEIYG